MAKTLELSVEKLSESEKKTFNQQKSKGTGIATTLDTQFAAAISKKTGGKGWFQGEPDATYKAKQHSIKQSSNNQMANEYG